MDITSQFLRRSFNNTGSDLAKVRPGKARCRAELGRAAQAAMRSTSTSLLRTAPIRPHQPQQCRNLALTSALSRRNHTSTPSKLHSSSQLVKPASVSATSPAKMQQQSYASFDWANPARRGPRGFLDNISDIQIRKPNSASYDMAFGDQKDEDAGNIDSDFASDLDIADLRLKKQSRIGAPDAPRSHLRLVPRTGRTVHVGNNVDVARSFKLLAVQIGQNKLRREFQLQKFHERPGMKRKRLRSERWQSRFKKGFKATISRVRELTAQGW
ncbi:hypothetical protein F5Y03DRAFT_385898 [Xylaria venustula]|nr:hypothetical protein F5Y03DRAFT_385898 [Xylaria venustula]